MAYNHEYPYVDPSRYNDDWLINKVKELAAEWSKVQQDWKTEQEAFESLKAFVNNYFDNLDVQHEIDNKLDAMAQDGTLYEIIHQYIDNSYRRYIFIGDSYGVGYNPDSETNKGWPSYVIENLGLINSGRFWTAVASGAGFSQTNSFLNLLKSVNTGNPNAITDIVVCGGVNDATSQTTANVLAAINRFMDFALTTYPNATVTVGEIGGSRNGSIRNDLTRVLNNYQVAATYSNGRYMSNAEYILCDRRLISSDDVHPTDNGYSELGKHISNFLKNGNIDVVRSKESISVTLPNGTASSFEWSQNNGLITINLPSTEFKVAGGGLFTDPQTFFTINKTIPFNGTGNSIGNGTILATVSGNKQSFPCYIRMSDTALQFTTITGTTIGNVSTARVFAYDIVLNAMYH